MPKESVLSATRRGHGWWWVGAAVAAVVVVVLLVLLLRDDQGGAAASTATTEAGADLATLRAEALAHARRWYKAGGEADATADATKLDGIFVPGSKLDEFERDEAERRARTGRIYVARFDMVDMRVVAVDPSHARVQGTITRTAGVTRDKNTGKVLRREPAFRRRVEVQLDRVEGRWLVATAIPLGPPEFPEGE